MTVCQKGELLYAGKAKDLYHCDQANCVIAHFRDDTSAFDGVKMEKLSDKGSTNNQINAYLMTYLQEKGIPTHFIERTSLTDSVFERLTMIPLEAVVRNVAAGSLCRRLGVKQGTIMDPPLFEYFLKNDELHDPMVTRRHALAFSWATEEQLDAMESMSLAIHAALTELLGSHDLTLVDAKYEFGVNAKGEVVLGDEISPDSCRIWDSQTGEAFDKDRFRKDMGDVIAFYRAFAERIGMTLES